MTNERWVARQEKERVRTCSVDNNMEVEWWRETQEAARKEKEVVARKERNEERVPSMLEHGGRVAVLSYKG